MQKVFNKKFIYIFVLFLIAFSFLLPIPIYASENLPTKYDLRSEINIPTVNQGGTALCWAFSSNRVIETFMAKNFNTSLDLSESWVSLAYMKYVNDDTIEKTYNVMPNKDIQNYTYGNSAHFKIYENTTNYYGFASENDVPFSIGQDITTENYEEIFDVFAEYASTNLISNIKFDWCGYYGQQNKVGDVDEKQVVLNMKDYLFNFGAIYLQSSYALENYNNISYLRFRNNGDTFTHALTIIGYDDDITIQRVVDNSISTHKGAFLVANSYGENKEFCYMFYDDVYHLTGCYYIEELFYNSLKMTLADISNCKLEQINQIDIEMVASCVGIGLCAVIISFGIVLLKVNSKLIYLKEKYKHLLSKDI